MFKMFKVKKNEEKQTAPDSSQMLGYNRKETPEPRSSKEFLDILVFCIGVLYSFLMHSHDGNPRKVGDRNSFPRPGHVVILRQRPGETSGLHQESAGQKQLQGAAIVGTALLCGEEDAEPVPWTKGKRHWNHNLPQ